MKHLLTEGTQVARYRVSGFIGAGGMGEVYRAHDPALDRSVALKVLPAARVGSEESLRRFVHEAKTASALSHPNIVTIHEIGEVETTSPDGTPQKVHYIAMELVEGDSLRRKIETKTDLPRILDILMQVAEALAKAHAIGIIHRDLKPENIMVSNDGYAKVVDFGLAKLIQKPQDAVENMSVADTSPRHGITVEGVMLGTVGYMAPEQIEGRMIDHRADIFSFGCILYEAITGRPPFRGATMIDTLHAIVHDNPVSISEQRPNAPIELQRIVKKCLAKDPEARYQSAKDIAIDLREVRTEMSSGTQPRMTIGRAHSRWSNAIVAVVAVVVIAAVAVAFFVLRDRTPQRATRTFTMQQITSDGNVRSADISPDGKYLAYTMSSKGQSALLLQQLSGGNTIKLLGPHEDFSYGSVRFSHDGSSIYYWKLDRKAQTYGVFRIPTLGGASRKIVERSAGGVIPSPDGKSVAFVRHDPSTSPHEMQLLVATADGASERKVIGHREPSAVCCPAWSADAKRLFFAECLLTDAGFHCAPGEIDIATRQQNMTKGDWRTILDIEPLDDEHLLISGTRTDVDPLQLWEFNRSTGAARRLTHDVHQYLGARLPADRSRIVTMQVQARAQLWAAEGATAEELTSGSSFVGHTRSSQQGRVAYQVAAGGRYEIRLREPSGEQQQLQASATSYDFQPDLTPDGNVIVFSSTRSGTINIWKAVLDGSTPVQLTKMKTAYWPDSSPDGTFVIFVSSDTGQPSLWRMPLAGGAAQSVSKEWLTAPAISPDGKLIAAEYWDEKPDSPHRIVIVSMENGQITKHLSLPLTASRRVRWSPDGRSISYVDTKQGVSNIWQQTLDGSAPRQLTQFKEKLIFSFDWSGDGKKLLCARGESISDVYQLVPE